MKYVQIKDLGKIITGNTPKTSDLRNYEAKDINFIKPSDIVSFNYIEKIKNSEYFISEYARKNARIVPRNTVLVTCIGIIGKVAVTDKEVAFNQQINAIIPDIQKVDPLYLAYAISAKRKYIHDKANAAVVPIINKTNFSSLKIKLFSLTKQKEIVSQLDELDNIISLICQQLTKLDELVKSRFVEMFGDKDYPTKPIGDVVDRDIERVGKTFNADDVIRYIDISSVDNKSSRITGCTEYVVENAPSRAQYVLQKDDILYSTVRPNLKNMAINPYDDGDIVGSTGFCVLRCKDVTTRYLWGVLTSDRFTHEMVKKATGANYPAVSDKTVLNYEIAVPPMDMQNQYEEFVKLADKSKLVVQKLLAKAELLREKLMQDYFG